MTICANIFFQGKGIFTENDDDRDSSLEEKKFDHNKNRLIVKSREKSATLDDYLLESPVISKRMVKKKLNRRLFANGPGSHTIDEESQFQGYNYSHQSSSLIVDSESPLPIDFFANFDQNIDRFVNGPGTTSPSHKSNSEDVPCHLDHITNSYIKSKRMKISRRQGRRVTTTTKVNETNTSNCLSPSSINLERFSPSHLTSIESESSPTRELVPTLYLNDITKSYIDSKKKNVKKLFSSANNSPNNKIIINEEKNKTTTKITHSHEIFEKQLKVFSVAQKETIQTTTTSSNPNEEKEAFDDDDFNNLKSIY